MAGGAGGAGGMACTSAGLGGAAWFYSADPPDGHRRAERRDGQLHDRGIGSQVYTCTMSGGAGGAGGATPVVYSWTVAPDAKLYDTSCTQVGTHQAGPKTPWTSGNGTITGTKLAQADSPNAGAIPSLLLKVTIPTSTGPFAGVTYVQRLNTSGGLQPAAGGCNSGTVNSVVNVSYSADYYFFTGGAGRGRRRR